MANYTSSGATLPLLSRSVPTLSVGELTALIKKALESGFGRVCVRGEISNFVAHSSGHYYFTLKDSRSQIKAACFKGSQRGLQCTPRNGMEVLATGRLSVYEPRGEYQLIVDGLEESGLGRLMAAFERLKEKLKQEGLFDEARKRPLPLLPARVGVVTSPTGAAVRDILQVLGRRNSSVRVLLWPARVQGEGAAAAVAEGVDWFNRAGNVDVLIVGRGGGSLEDLWAFNDEALARAVAASRIPVISAVGHEIDFTICDFVADLRAPTPSAAAEIVARAASELSEKVAAFAHRLQSSMGRALSDARHRVELLGGAPALVNFPYRLQSCHQKVDDLESRLPLLLRRRRELLAGRLQQLVLRLSTASPTRRLDRAAASLDALTARLAYAMQRSAARRGEALRLCESRLEPAVRLALERKRRALGLAESRQAGLDPRAVLGRGYAICLDGSGRSLRSYRQAAAGDPVQVLLAEGDLGCRVETSSPGRESARHGPETPPEAPAG